MTTAKLDHVKSVGRLDEEPAVMCNAGCRKARVHSSESVCDSRDRRVAEEMERQQLKHHQQTFGEEVAAAQQSPTPHLMMGDLCAPYLFTKYYYWKSKVWGLGEM